MMVRVQKSASKAVAELGVEMARPRFAASVLVEVGVVSSFRGIYARIARKIEGQSLNGKQSG
jgi:hypothetical protein